MSTNEGMLPVIIDSDSSGSAMASEELSGGLKAGETNDARLLHLSHYRCGNAGLLADRCVSS